MANRRLSIVLDLDTGGYSGRIATAGSQMKTFGGEVSASSRQVQSMGKAFDNLSNVMSTPSQRLRDYVLVLGNLRLAMLNVRDIAVGWVAGLVKQSAEVERLITLMKGMSVATTDLGKATEAQKNLQYLYDLSRKSGFAIGELTDAFVKFKSAGIDPMNGSLNSLTDAVAFFGGNTETMHRAAIAIQQMAGKGVVSMEELRQQLGEAVPTAMADMADAAGMSMQKFTKVVSQGKVQAQPALELMFREFQLKYAGAGSRMAQTLNGQLAAFKSNVTELSTYFTGMASGNTDAFKSYVADQQRLLDEGKITQQQFLENSKPQSGLFSGVTNAMKDINEALRSTEGREMMIQLGQTINSVGTSLLNAAKFVVEWRDVIIVGGKAALAAFLAIKAVKIAEWFAEAGAAAYNAMTNIGGATTKAGQTMMNMASQADRSAQALQRLQSIQALRVQRLNQEISASGQLAQATQAEVASAAARRAAISQNINVLSQQWYQENRQLQTAKLLNEANISVGRSTVASSEAVAVAQTTLNETTKSLLRSRAELRVADEALIAAETRLATVHSTGLAATQRLAVAEAATARQISIKSVALKTGEIATGLYRNTTEALNTSFVGSIRTVGLKTVALNGVTNAMNVARNTTGNLVNSVTALTRNFTLSAVAARASATATDVATAATTLFSRAVNASTTAIELQATAARLAAGAASLMGRAISLALGPMGMIALALYTAADAAGVFESATDKATAAVTRLMTGIADLEAMKAAQKQKDYNDKIIKSYESGNTAMDSDGWAGIGTRHLINKAGDYFGVAPLTNATGATKQQYDAALASNKLLEDSLRIGKKAIDIQEGKDEYQSSLRLREQYVTPLQGNFNSYISGLRQDRQSGKITDAQFKSMHDKAEADLTGKIDGYDAKYRKSIQEQRDHAQAVGQSTLKWDAMLQAMDNGASSATKSGKSIEDLRGQLIGAGNGADKLAKKIKSARDHYNEMIAGQEGDIAKLKEQIAGYSGELAKFDAELAEYRKGKNNKFKFITPEQIAEMRANYAEIDKLNEQLRAKNAIKGISKDIVKTTEDAKGLWAALANNNWDSGERASQYRAQFSNLLEGITDPKKIAEINGLIDQFVQKSKQIDAAGVAHSWDEATRDIKIGLMDEDAARNANYEREIQRQYGLIDWTSLSVSQRLQAEQRYNDYVTAMRTKQGRENESSIIKMSRDWMRLGHNMDQALSGTLSTFVDDLADGKDAFGDFAENILKSLAKVILQAMIAYAIMSALGMTGGQSFGSFMSNQMTQFGSGFANSVAGGGNAAASSAITAGAASGNAGLATSVQSLATPKFHTGGWFGSEPLKDGEVPLVGLDDEVALTQHQQRFYGSMWDAANNQSNPNVQVNVINNSGTGLTAEQGEPQFNGKDMIIGVVVEAASRQGPLRDALQNLKG